MKNLCLCLAVWIVSASFGVASVHAADAVLNATKYKDEASIQTHRDELVTVTLRGKVSHAAYVDYHAIVSGVSVWLAEYPESRRLGVISDAKGWWTLKILKPKGVELKVSLLYAKPGWITTKSNVMTIADKDDTDIAMQYINPIFYRLLVKPLVELMMEKLEPPVTNASLKNAMVVTVGKSWASIHCDWLPHGDPGATLDPIPGAVGPLYFDETVKPNPAYTKTSVDGGVAWLNVPKGSYVTKTHKQGVKYREVEFAVTDADVKEGVLLYIASPPDGVQGDNDSPPGKN